MNALEFVAGLISRGVAFTVDGDRLRVRDPYKATTPGERALISALKPAIRPLLLTELPRERADEACAAFEAHDGIALCRDCGFSPFLATANVRLLRRQRRGERDLPTLRRPVARAHRERSDVVTSAERGLRRDLRWPRAGYARDLDGDPFQLVAEVSGLRARITREALPSPIKRHARDVRYARARRKATLKTIEIRLRAEKETPGTQRYEAEDLDAPVRYVYLQKTAFAPGDAPKAIGVTIVALAN